METAKKFSENINIMKIANQVVQEVKLEETARLLYTTHSPISYTISPNNITIRKMNIMIK